MRAADHYPDCKNKPKVAADARKAVHASTVRTFIFNGKVRITGTPAVCKAFGRTLEEMNSKPAQKDS